MLRRFQVGGEQRRCPVTCRGLRSLAFVQTMRPAHDNPIGFGPYWPAWPSPRSEDASAMQTADYARWKPSPTPVSRTAAKPCWGRKARLDEAGGTRSLEHAPVISGSGGLRVRLVP